MQIARTSNCFKRNLVFVEECSPLEPLRVFVRLGQDELSEVLSRARRIAAIVLGAIGDNIWREWG